MNLQQQRLFNEMKFHHVGREHAIARRDLLMLLYGPEAAVDESNNNRYDREMRQMIQELNQQHGALICPSMNGYFWAESLDEVLQATEAIERGARTQLINIGHLKANARRVFGGQMKMGL